MSILSKRLIAPAVLLLLLASAVPAGAVLRDHGPQGEYFLETDSGLYWFDPSHFNEQARVTLDLLAAHSTVWSWATQNDLNFLLGSSTEGEAELETVLGPRHSTVGVGAPRWMGYYDGTGDDGWIVQAVLGPPFDTIEGAGDQANAAAFGAGAWFVSAVDPMTATTVIEDLAGYFLDTSTGLYWRDPGAHLGQDRPAVEAWLATHADWRWATRDEVFGLLGKRTTDGRTLESVFGPPSSRITNGGPRWVGWFVEDGIVNGLILQSGIAPAFDLLDTGSTQANAGAFNPGAWLVSDTEPTAEATAAWGDVKRDWR